MSEKTRIIRAIILDDEPPARALIRNMLKDDPDIQIIGEYSNGRDGIRSIRDESPDLMFLDVQMPGLDGFAMLEELDETPLPAVIFVTAYDKYAVRAFEIAAVDYLLKPFDHDRLEIALSRVRSSLHKPNDEDRVQQIMTLLAQVRSRQEYMDRFVIKDNGRVLFVRSTDIDWIEAEGNYLTLHAGKSSYLLRETMLNLERRLDPGRFARIHRSAMVNLDRVKELRMPVYGGEHLVILQDGHGLALSRRYRQKVSQSLHVR